MKTIIMLGRTGDVLNLLPAIEYEAKQNNYKPKLIVAKQYADILDGCSYVEKIVFNGNFAEILPALAFARKRFPNDEIVNCAVYSKDFPYKKECATFTRELWRLSGCPIAQNKLPLTFDNRDEERERKVLNDLKISKPFILLAFSGHSSPFDYKLKLKEYIESEIKDFQIIDISDYRAERFYDLLALYEKAHVLIATDSAPLHLANAVPNLPVIALTSDTVDDWHESSWKPQHILRLPYKDVPNNLNRMIEAVREPKGKERFIS